MSQCEKQQKYSGDSIKHRRFHFRLRRSRQSTIMLPRRFKLYHYKFLRGFVALTHLFISFAVLLASLALGVRAKNEKIELQLLIPSR
jgi:hypothetical protein